MNVGVQARKILTNLSLFSGVGGMDLGARMVGGIQTIAYVENDRYAQGVLRSRIADGGLDDAPIWSDVNDFDGKPWRGVDIVSGGPPCQPHSSAGNKKGAEDERNLWPDFRRIVREVRPRYVLIENVLGIFDTGYAAVILGDLEEDGYCATPFKNSSCASGAPHMRQRVFILAHSAGLRKFDGKLRKGNMDCKSRPIAWKEFSVFNGGVADGLAFRNDRTKCCGNGVDPYSALPAWKKIKEWEDLTESFT